MGDEVAATEEALLAAPETDDAAFPDPDMDMDMDEEAGRELDMEVTLAADDEAAPETELAEAATPEELGMMSAL